MPTILSNYELEDAFNADDFDLFYQCLLDKTYHLKGLKCSREKKSKVRVTRIVTGSATGEKFSMFIIGKLKTSHCFKNIKHLLCQYVTQKKSWRNSQIFEHWVCKFNFKFLDNCTAHSSISNLGNVPTCSVAPKHYINSSCNGRRCH